MKKPKHNFAIDPQSDAIKQFEDCIKEDFVIAGALMPDAHTGYVAPIGSVLVTKDYIVPAWVGYDIGCGMIAIKFSSNKNIINIVKNNIDEIYNIVNKIIPMGLGELNKNISKEGLQKFKELFAPIEKSIKDKNFVNKIKSKAQNSLGTLGSGNHFIELGADENEQNLWLIIHSGSRIVGHQVATHYMKKASGQTKGYEKTAAININSEIGKEYLLFQNFCLEYALLNRIEIAKKVFNILKQYDETLRYELWTNKNHNHAIREEGIEYRVERVENRAKRRKDSNNPLISNHHSPVSYFIHRKGATPAKKGERGVIPGNMRDGSFLVEGLGNKEFLESSSHGAGRKLSRKQAKKDISQEMFKESMKGIKATLTDSIRDEAPQAYKNIFDVMNAQKESVKVIAHIKPIINWKG